MIYLNTENKNRGVSFREAVLDGVAPGGGLYVPCYIPRLPASFFQNSDEFSDTEIAYRVLFPYVHDSIPEYKLKEIIARTLSFPVPVMPVHENIFSLELFHGPTLSFKDIGARFMAEVISFFTNKGQEITVLAATSGDTGSAVACGFYKVKGVKVKVLFPQNGISSFQESQITSLGENIQPIEVKGTFDDCQYLVKTALEDITLRKKITVSSSNSINVARLLPQMLYYFLAYKQLYTSFSRKPLVVSVPCGNFGNLTAGLYAKKSGLPVYRFIAANNANDAFHRYCKTGSYDPCSAVTTYSNAMDVGAPNNFKRIMDLYNYSHSRVTGNVFSSSFTDAQTIEKIKSVYERHGYVCDPHGAVALLGLEKFLQPSQTGLFLATAHPSKFERVVQNAIPGYKALHNAIKKGEKITIPASYKILKGLLLDN